MAGQFLYIHVPFCEKKCPYCDFFSLPGGARAAALAEDWLEVIAREMELWHEAGQLSRSTPIETLFFGGGTPSLLSSAAMTRFLDFVRENYTLAPKAEITVEMQPATADARKVAEYARAGVNRFSVGVQTFSPELLKILGRRHTVEQSRELLFAAKQAGEVSLDLICALPGQSLSMWQEELAQALSFDVGHISVYELTFYSETEFARRLKTGQIAQSEESLRLEIYEKTAEVLGGAGYEHYEISNYARPGARSRHNENYWKLGDYIGLGAGAHSFLFPHRYMNACNVEAYKQSILSGKLFRSLSDSSDRELFVLENLQMPLRLTEGVDLDWFARKFGEDLRQTKGRQLKTLQEAGLLAVEGSRLKLTQSGRLQFDSVLEYLL